MFYEINVSINGRHFFATAERSLTTEAEFNKALGIFKEKFPESEGYKLSASKWEKSGREIKI
ncbi:hypothetical protein [Paenibacillus illinoisensis]|uniref:hypothetical protein n=1 Tax=Paenibacillus illinoisensis TaxID=59845 RepID=UPI0030161E87